MDAPAYVVDRDYTRDFHPETAPGHLAFALEVASVSSPLPRLVLDLGCGQGFGLALLAAANPDIRFEGYDINASHVAHATELIEAAALDNVTVETASFALLVERGGARDVDLAVAHGVYSWVEPSVQDDMLAILAGRLTAGGVAAISYNCLPGWGPLDPIRELARAMPIDRVRDDPAERLLACLASLDAAGAAYLAVTPAARGHVAAMVGADKAYLAHEYCGTAARALPVREVHRRFAAAGLAYAGTATVVEALDAFAVLPSMRGLVEAAPAGPWRETLRDFGSNRSFRRDIFRCGGGDPRSVPAAPTYALLVPPAEALAPIPGPFGPIRGRADIFSPLVAVLEEAPATAAALNARLRGASAAQVSEALALLVHGHRVAPVFGPTQDPRPAKRFNDVLIERAKQGHFYGHLASPVARTGVRVDPFELLALGAARAVLAPKAAAASVRAGFAASPGHADAAPTDAQIAEDFAAFATGARPRLAALDV